jgi:hypothetical protein
MVFFEVLATVFLIAIIWIAGVLTYSVVSKRHRIEMFVVKKPSGHEDYFISD